MIIARCLGTSFNKFCLQSYLRHPRHAHILWNVSRLTERSPDIMITYIVNYLRDTEGDAGDVNKTIFFSRSMKARYERNLFSSTSDDSYLNILKRFTNWNFRNAILQTALAKILWSENKLHRSVTLRHNPVIYTLPLRRHNFWVFGFWWHLLNLGTRRPRPSPESLSNIWIDTKSTKTSVTSMLVLVDSRNSATFFATNMILAIQHRCDPHISFIVETGYGLKHLSFHCVEFEDSLLHDFKSKRIKLIQSASFFI